MSNPPRGAGGQAPPIPGGGGGVAETLDMTAPKPAKPATSPMAQNGPQNAPTPPPRAMTQVSASAVPSTLESPREAGDGPTQKTARPFAVDEIVGGAVIAEDTARDEQAPVEIRRELARREAAGRDPGRQGAPPTLMSPLVADAPPVAPGTPSVPPPAVTFAQAPAHAYLPAAPSGGHASSPVYPAGGGLAPIGHRAGGPLSTGRSSNGLIIGIFAVGVVIVVVAVAVSIVALVYRSRDDAEPPQRSAPSPRQGPGGGQRGR